MKGLVKGEMKRVSEVYKDWKKIVKDNSIPKKYCIVVRD